MFGVFKCAHFSLSGDYIRGWNLGQPASQRVNVSWALRNGFAHILCSVVAADDDCITKWRERGGIKIVSMGEVWHRMSKESGDCFVVPPVILCQH